MGISDAFKSRKQIAVRELKIWERQLKISERQLEMEKRRLEIFKKGAELQREKELNEGVAYKVQIGDNLGIISQAADIPISILQDDNKNKIKDINKINAGDTIFLQYHPKPEDAINSESMNEGFSYLDQGYYLVEVEDEALERFHEVSEKGAQQYLKDQKK